MFEELTKQQEEYVLDSIGELEELIERLCGIPAPSTREEKRAEFCMQWLKRHGAEGVYIDSAQNAVYPVCGENRDAVVFLAHSDTVFPDLAPMPFNKDEKRMYAPGVGDNTASVAIMLMVIKYILQNNVSFENDALFVVNSCEEGLGNLRGVREIAGRYKDRISKVIAFDGGLGISDRCVGSHRYRVKITAEGGHSYNDFGRDNAIVLMSGFIRELNRKKIPRKGTTYNIGSICGGTSVNTIPQSCEILYEYRSDDKECLGEMEAFFKSAVYKARENGTRIEYELIGERPCMGDVDEQKQEELKNKCIETVSCFDKKPVRISAASTDCNIPLSMGIPAVCVGLYEGGGAHTREEWIERDSLPTGMRIAMKLIFGLLNRK